MAHPKTDIKSLLENANGNQPPAPEPKPEAEAEKTAAARPPSREDKKGVTTWLPRQAHAQLAYLKIETGKSVQELGVEAINLLFERYEKPPIAE